MENLNINLSVKELTDMVAKTLGVDISKPEDAKKLFNEINKASQVLKDKKVKPMKIKSLDSKATPEEKASKIREAITKANSFPINNIMAVRGSGGTGKSSVIAN